MLTIVDAETIKNAIWKRLHEPGKTEIADIQVLNKPDATPPHIQVGVWCILRDRVQDEGLIDPRSYFDLPAEFSRQHLLNEIDQIAEQLKEIRARTKVGRMLWKPGHVPERETVKGTGLRGLWPQ